MLIEGENGLLEAIEPRRAQRASRATLVATPLDHLDVRAYEPMLIEHPDGTLFVSGYGAGHATLWKSRDHGATWARVDVSISIGVSKDVGATWSWTLLSKVRFDDRPWVAVAPDGIVHAIWNDGSGVGHALSADGGRTWKVSPKIHPKGGSSHRAMGPKGEVAVRVTPLSASCWTYDKDVDLIALSTDAGATWQTYPAPGKREWSPQVDTSVTPPPLHRSRSPTLGRADSLGRGRQSLFLLDQQGRVVARAISRSRNDLDDQSCRREPRRGVLSVPDRARPW